MDEDGYAYDENDDENDEGDTYLDNNLPKPIDSSRKKRINKGRWRKEEVRAQIQIKHQRTKYNNPPLTHHSTPSTPSTHNERGK